MADFRKLKVWEKAEDLAADVMVTTAAARKRNRGNLRSQTDRAAISIPANIAEAKSGRSDDDQVRILQIAVGSCNELESHLRLGKKVGFVRPQDFERLNSQMEEVRKMLSGLIRYLSGGADRRFH
jgi:four helix bundle protein